MGNDGRSCEAIDFLELENARNKKHHKLYQALLAKAFGTEDTLIAHHLCYNVESNDPHRQPGETMTVEIPSADTLIFDHCIMQRIFGDDFMRVMSDCMMVPRELRDDVLARNFFSPSDPNYPSDVPA